MGRFVAGAVCALLLATGGLFWWQGQARDQQPAAPPSAPPAIPADTLPTGDPDAVGAAPPMPPEALAEDREAKRFGRYDANRDSIITRTEMLSTRTDEFRKLDTDRNNLLSFEEWAVRTSDRFAGADANRDGRLTRPEFATTAPKPAPRPKCSC